MAQDRFDDDPYWLLREIHRRLSQDHSLLDDMSHIIDQAEECFPHSDWKLLRSLPYEDELPELKSWFRTLLKNEPPTIAVAGIWFGLFEAWISRKESTSVLYVAAAPRFELDGDNSWAYRPPYFPEGRYANSRVLDGWHRVVRDKKTELEHLAAAGVAEAYAAFVAKRLVSEIEPSLFLTTLSSAGVAVGWDSGSPIYIGTLTRDGFATRDVDEAIKSLVERQKHFEQFLKDMDEGRITQADLKKQIQDLINRDD